MFEVTKLVATFPGSRADFPGIVEVETVAIERIVVGIELVLKGIGGALLGEDGVVGWPAEEGTFVEAGEG